MADAVERGFDWIEEKLQAAHQPPGHDHPSMLENKYISLSKLTSMTAVDLAGEILSEADDDYNTYWSFLGDGIADASYEQLLRAKTRLMNTVTDAAYPEVRVEMPVEGTDWTLRGHADMGVIYPDEEEGEVRVFALEHKWRSNLTTHDIQVALAQGGLYLCVAMEMLRTNGKDVLRLEPAPWAQMLYEDLPRGHMPLKKGWLPGGVHGCFITAGSDHPIYRRRRIDTPEKIQENIDYYQTKAQCVIESVEAGNYEAAIAWDEGPGLWEFEQRGPTVTSQEEVDELLDEKDELEDGIERLETRISQIMKQIREFLLMEPHEQITFPEDHKRSKVQIVRSKGSRFVNMTVGDLLDEADNVENEEFDPTDFPVKMKVGQAEDFGFGEYMGRGKPSSYVRID